MNTRRIVPAVAIALSALASTACATGYAYSQPRPYYDYREMERRAYDNGFREGVRVGEHDARDNRRYEPSRHGEWRSADDGYRHEFGNRDVYRRNFRGGFEAGYSQGFRRYDRWDRYDNGRNRRW